jgi:hypothetical protein
MFVYLTSSLIYPHFLLPSNHLEPKRGKENKQKNAWSPVAIILIKHLDGKDTAASAGGVGRTPLFL